MSIYARMMGSSHPYGNMGVDINQQANPNKKEQTNDKKLEAVINNLSNILKNSEQSQEKDKTLFNWKTFVE